jgi:ribosomal protein S18 acetylase RimI-like enzyme
MQPILKKLEYEGVRTLVDWAANEGWNPGLYDAGLFWVTDPDGFYGYFLDDEMIGGGSIVSYDKNFGFMGFFIMRPDFRSRGLGRQLWYERRDNLLKRLNPGAPIGMDGVVAMQSFYKKGGFEIAFRDERYELAGSDFEIAPQISPVNPDDFDAVLRFDQQCFGFPRPQFMMPWITQPGSLSFKYVQDGDLHGFVIMRKALNGFKICPLFADNEQIATELYKACLNSAGNEKVYLDIPVSNPAAVAMVKRFGASYVFECARMYYGTPPVTDVTRIFGITSFELG